jgi:hypothetical protein
MTDLHTAHAAMVQELSQYKLDGLTTSRNNFRNLKSHSGNSRACIRRYAAKVGSHRMREREANSRKREVQHPRPSSETEQNARVRLEALLRHISRPMRSMKNRSKRQNPKPKTQTPNAKTKERKRNISPKPKRHKQSERPKDTNVDSRRKESTGDLQARCHRRLGVVKIGAHQRISSSCRLR